MKRYFILVLNSATEAKHVGNPLIFIEVIGFNLSPNLFIFEVAPADECQMRDIIRKSRGNVLAFVPKKIKYRIESR